MEVALLAIEETTADEVADWEEEEAPECAAACAGVGVDIDADAEEGVMAGESAGSVDEAEDKPEELDTADTTNEDG